MNIVNTFTKLSLWYPVGEIAPALSGTQFIRWKKGRWMPVAASKMYRIPPRRPVLAENEELMRLYRNYRTQMKSLREHLKRENLRTSATSELAIQQVAELEEEHQMLMELNRQENARVAAMREKRLQEEQEADLARVIASKEKWEIQEMEQREEAIRIIAETQELVKTFITKENLEKAIEDALANTKDYNYALDSEGYVLRGRTTNPDENEEKEHIMSASQ